MSTILARVARWRSVWVTIGSLLTVALIGGGLAWAQADEATAEVMNANGQVVGIATFTEVPGGVRVTGTVQGLPPGAHGIHIHAVGLCEPPGFTSAGGHFNPTGRQHGLNNPAGPHVGDLPNLVVGADGTGSINAVASGATLGTGATSLFDADGSALVIHADPDDQITDPAGNAGARIACGLITRPVATIAVAPVQPGAAPAQAPSKAGAAPAQVPVKAAEYEVEAEYVEAEYAVDGLMVDEAEWDELTVSTDADYDYWDPDYLDWFWPW